MRRIALSLVTILATVAMVSGATKAVFSATDNVNGNTVSTAKLSIDARVVINKPLSDLNLLPGTWGNSGAVDLYNDGNSSQRQWMYVQNVQGALCNYVQLKVGYGWNVQPNPYNMDVVFGTYTLAQLTGSEHKLLVGRSDPVEANITTRLVQQPYVVSEAPNELQQSTCSWDEVFLATQPGQQ